MSDFVTKKRIMDIVALETGGNSYKSHKYCLDEVLDTAVEYGETPHYLQWEGKGETKANKGYINIKALSVQVTGSQLLSYFLDGSRHVYKVDDMGFKKSGKRMAIYPIMAGQIGVGCCHRTDKYLKAEYFENEIVMSMPDIAEASGKKTGFWQAMAQKLNSSAEMERLTASGWSFGTILPYKSSAEEKTYNDKGTAQIQKRMMENEQKMVATLVSDKKLNDSNYLVKDGSLEYLPSSKLRADKHSYAQYKNNYAYVIGVSKRFNPEACVDANNKTNPGFIAELPLYHRTPAAYYTNEYLGDIGFAVWYLRIRDAKKTQTPFDGIIKVEKVLVSNEEIKDGIISDLADVISAHLINERNPVCFGSDNRWANHLYPIYLTEQYVKSRYLSTAAFLHLF